MRRPTKLALFLCFLALGLVISAMPTLASRPSLIDSEGERFVYLPSVFASMMLAVTVVRLARARLPRAMVSVVLLAVLTAFLELSNHSWHVAGEMTQSIMSSLEAQPPGRHIVMLAVPDNLNGAFVFRNSLQDGLLVFAPQRRLKVSIVGFSFLKDPDEQVTVTPNGVGRYSVTLPGERGTVHMAGGVLDPAVRLMPGGLYRYDLSVLTPVRAAYFSGGHLQFTDLQASGPS